MTDASATPPGYALLAVSPFGDLTGPYYGRAAADGRYSLLVHISDRHPDRGGSMHDGMMMYAAGLALTRAVRHSLGDANVSTLSVQCDFIAAPGHGWLEAAAWVTRKTSAVIFSSGEIRSAGGIVMTFSGLLSGTAAQ